MVSHFQRVFKRSSSGRCQTRRSLTPPSMSSSSYSSASQTETPTENNSPVSSYSTETTPVSASGSISPRSLTSLQPSCVDSDFEAEDKYIPVAALPVFKGDSSECPFLHMCRFDHACRANNVISESMAARIFPASLDSVAAMWYDTFIDPCKPWKEIRADFLACFRQPIPSKLSSLHQSNDETVNHYYIRFMFILNRCPDHNLSEQTLVSTFIDGLNKGLNDWVSSQEPSTLSEALKLAKSREIDEKNRESRERPWKQIIKCEFCGLTGHEELACNVKKKMIEMWHKSSAKGSLLKREGSMGRFGKSMSCPTHQDSKKIERTESVLNRQQEKFYDAAEE